MQSKTSNGLRKTKSNSKILKVFETFSGIGAQHKALQFLKDKYNYDYKVVGTSEWDVDAQISYAAIHYPRFELIVKSVSEKKMNEYFAKFDHSFTGKDLTPIEKIYQMETNRKTKYYKAHRISNNMGSILGIEGGGLYKSIGDIDLITYSFPCQDLSVAGSFHGFNQGMAKGEGTRSGLLWEIGRILTELKEIDKTPKFLLLENVPNMISSRHIDDYIAWKKELYNLGYQTKTYIVNARDHGLAQNRKRVYAISIKGNYKIDDQFEIIDLEEKIFPKKFEKVSKLKTRELKDIIKQNYENPIHKNEAIEAIPNRTPSRKRMFHLNYKLNDFDKYKYSRTVTTKQDRHPNAGVIDLKNTILESHDGIKANYRFITTREAYLLMGFDDKDYNNVKKQNIRKEKLYQQAGNSIAVYAITAIIKKIQELNNE